MESSRQNRKLKVLVVGLSLPPETFLARLIKGLLDAGVELTLHCGRRPKKPFLTHPLLRWLPKSPWYRVLPVQLFRLLWLSVRDAPRALGRIRLHAPHVRHAGGRWRRVQRWYRRLPFLGQRWDLIYFPWNAAAITHLQLFDLGSPVVISCRGAHVNVATHVPKRDSISEGLKTTFARATAVHCVSDAIMRESEQYGLDAGKAVVIRPAVNPDFFHPAAHKPQHAEFRIITTGSLIWRKDHECALVAVRRLIDSGVAARLDIIGDGPERQRLLYAICDLGLSGRVHLHGRLTPEAVRARLQASDVFVLTSVSEGISNAVLEAMACGLAVVVTESGGMREAVADGVEGLVVGVRDAVGVAEALGELAGDGERRAVMGRAGRARVEREFTLAGQVAQFLRLCHAAAAQHSGEVTQSSSDAGASIRERRQDNGMGKPEAVAANAATDKNASFTQVRRTY